MRMDKKLLHGVDGSRFTAPVPTESVECQSTQKHFSPEGFEKKPLVKHQTVIHRGLAGALRDADLH